MNDAGTASVMPHMAQVHTLRFPHAEVERSGLTVLGCSAHTLHSVELTVIYGSIN